MTVNGTDRHALLFQLLQPGFGFDRVGHIHLVQRNDTGLVPCHLPQHGVDTGIGNAGIQQFHHHVHQAQLVLHHAPGLGHMSGKPLDLFHIAVIHKCLLNAF